MASCAITEIVINCVPDEEEEEEEVAFLKTEGGENGRNESDRGGGSNSG